MLLRHSRMCPAVTHTAAEASPPAADFADARLRRSALPRWRTLHPPRPLQQGHLRRPAAPHRLRCAPRLRRARRRLHEKKAQPVVFTERIEHILHRTQQHNKSAALLVNYYHQRSLLQLATSTVGYPPVDTSIGSPSPTHEPWFSPRLSLSRSYALTPWRVLPCGMGNQAVHRASWSR